MISAVHKLTSIEDCFAEADKKAMDLQGVLVQRQNVCLAVTLVSICLLAGLAFAMHTAALQVLCPVAVFFMIQYLDYLRKSENTFHFVSSRLTAETLRVVGAARDKSALLDMIVSTRSLSTHPVAEESARTCEPAYGLLSTHTNGLAVRLEPSNDFWNDWLAGQTAYYVRASNRELARGRSGKTLFNVAFTLVALIGLGASVWSISNPAAIGSDVFRALMTMASLIGSCGLAYINFVKDRKAFDQSFDYDHMYQVLSGSVNSRDIPRDGEAFERLVVTATLNEHIRWALRMAGHFKKVPS